MFNVEVPASKIHDVTNSIGAQTLCRHGAVMIYDDVEWLVKKRKKKKKMKKEPVECSGVFRRLNHSTIPVSHILRRDQSLSVIV